ncbi:MATE family efflux transporter [Castellaniella sp.]|uniref:MATE family efflux transporter n=1 Tax=Castellaniella sp. TaxID=1955812 RepID=UPI00355CA0CA
MSRYLPVFLQRPWRAEILATITLGLPLISAQLAQMAINMTNTLVLGRLGPDELAASVLGWQLFFVVWILGTGFGFAVMPLVAGAASSQDARGIARFVHMGLWVSLAYTVLMAWPLSNAEPIFLALGQEASISQLAAEYVRVLQWSMFPQLAIIVLRSFLGGVQRPTIVVIALAGGAVVNLVLNVTLVFGVAGLVPALGMRGAAWATVLATTCVALFLFWFAARHRSVRKHRLGRRILQPDRPALNDIFRLGWPIGITLVAEVGLFTATSVMMGWLGAHELAAHGIAVQLSGVAFMVPLGLSAASTIRTGWARGRDDRDGVACAALSAIFIGLGFAGFSAMAFLLLPAWLVGLYLDLHDTGARQVLSIAIGYLAVAAAFQLFDALQALANGALRGLKDTRIPMVLALVSYWLLGVPTSYVLGFILDWGGIGVWWGQATGLGAAAILLGMRLVRQIRAMPRTA